MKKSYSTLLTTGLFIFSSHVLLAQNEFGMKPYCDAAGTFPQKTIASSILKNIMHAVKDQVDPLVYCIGDNTAPEATGFETDFDGDGKTEILCLLRRGTDETGCSALFMLHEDVNKTYEMLDLFPLGVCKASVYPVRLFSKGMQFYAESEYILPDGVHEKKGALFAYEKQTIAILISWTQKDGMKDGRRTTVRAQCGLADFDFDHEKELYLRYTTYIAGAGKLDEKNILDQYVLQLEFMKQQYRYAIYDSSGYDKIQNAAALTKSGERLIARDATAEDGVLKLQDAIGLNPVVTEARIILGRYYLRTGKPGDAERMFLQAIEIDPLTPASYLYLGDTYIKLNSLQQSLDNFKKYLELNPNTRERKSVESKIRQITIPKRR